MQKVRQNTKKQTKPINKCVNIVEEICIDGSDDFKCSDETGNLNQKLVDLKDLNNTNNLNKTNKSDEINNLEIKINKMIESVKKKEKEKYDKKLERIILKEKKKMLDKLIDLYPGLENEKDNIFEKCIKQKKEGEQNCNNNQDNKKSDDIVLDQFQYNGNTYYKYKNRILNEKTELIGSVVETDELNIPTKCVFFDDKPIISNDLKKIIEKTQSN